MIATSDKSPKTKELLAKLEEPIAMKFADETPLEKVLNYIKSETREPNANDIPIYVDPVGLKEAGKTMTSPVVLDLEGVALKTTLRLLLKQIGLAYCVKDGVVIISSPIGVIQELTEASTQEQREELDLSKGFP